MNTRAPSKKRKKSHTHCTAPLKASKRVHPEDLKIGDDVAISETHHQLATCCWLGLDSFQYPPDQSIRLSLMASGDHHPQKVKSICLPFVLCQQSDGKHVVHDLRQMQLSRLDATFAADVATALQSDKQASHKAKKKKTKKKKQAKRTNRKSEKKKKRGESDDA